MFKLGWVGLKQSCFYGAEDTSKWKGVPTTSDTWSKSELWAANKEVTGTISSNRLCYRTDTP